MEQILLIVLAVLAAVSVVLLIILLARRPKTPRDLSGALSDLADRQAGAASETRQELLHQFKNLNQISLAASAQAAGSTQRELEALRASVDRRLAQIQADNERQLAQMRATVDKQLNQTLSANISASFSSVSDQLKQVYESMGALKSMTGDILDLKRVLSSVKTRGGWGEVQLGALLEEFLSPAQFLREARLSTGPERVDFAVKLPAMGGEVLLPIDAKFPMDMYQAVLRAQDAADAQALARATEALRRAVLEQGKSIRQKYVQPPVTTDFAILFVPSEGLYAQLSSMQTADELRQTHRVMLSGPSTLAALLTSLQLGFQTIAVEQKSEEILALMAAVKRSFSTFSANIESVQKSLHAAQNNLERLSSSARGLERRLHSVESIGKPSMPADD